MEEDKKEQQPPIIDQLKEYAETRIKLAKYKAIDGSTSVISSIVADLAVVLSLLIFFLFVSITLSFYLSEILESFWQGFGCVTVIYLVIFIILKVKKVTIEKALASKLIQKILN